MDNLLLEKIEYKIVENKHGVTKSFMYPTGQLFSEYSSNKKIGSWPLIHITRGKNPETGKRVWAKGFIAIGMKSLGFLTIGLFTFGVVAIGLFTISLILGIGLLGVSIGPAVGQLAISATISLGQFAIAPYLAVGQFACAKIAIGQFAIGKYALGQIGFGKYVYSQARQDPQAKEFFKPLLEFLKIY